jgi:hypothetical protein
MNKKSTGAQQRAKSIRKALGSKDPTGIKPKKSAMSKKRDQWKRKALRNMDIAKKAQTKRKTK